MRRSTNSCKQQKCQYQYEECRKIVNELKEFIPASGIILSLFKALRLVALRLSIIPGPGIISILNR